MIAPLFVANLGPENLEVSSQSKAVNCQTMPPFQLVNDEQKVLVRKEARSKKKKLTDPRREETLKPRRLPSPFA